MVEDPADHPSIAPRRPLRVRTSPLGELFNSPEAWAVIIRRLPGLKLVTSVEKSSVYNILIPDLSRKVVPGDSKLFDQIDAELAQLSSEQGEGD